MNLWQKCQVEIALFECVVSLFFVKFLFKGGDGERLRQLPWSHKPFKLQYPPSPLYTLRMH